MAFETQDSHPKRWHQPVRVPQEKGGVFGAAKELVDDLQGWEVDAVDEESLTICITRKNRMLGGTSKIVVCVKGPDGIPNSETHCSSESSGGLLNRDKANVAEFIQKFWMRVT